jgi:Transglycosylase SLT domain
MPKHYLKQERIQLSWENGHPERQEWSDALIAALAQKVPDMGKAKDIKTFCPKFDLLEPIQKNRAFAELMIGMAKFESGYKPETAYRECDKTRCRYSSCFKHPTYGYCMIGNKNYDEGVITSRGLLQMSIHSSNAYGCGLKDSQQLHEPVANLECAVKILQSRIKTMGSIASSSPYWSVIKSSYSGNHIKEISSLVQKNVKECL